MTHSGGRGVGTLLCLVAAVAYGSVGIFGKLALEQGLSVEAMLSARFTIAALILWAFTASLGASVTVSRRGVAVGLLLGLVVYALQAGFYFWSLERLDASFTILLVQFAPVLVAVGAVAFGRERLSRRLLVSLPIALLGTALVATGARVGAADPLGVGLALACAVAYATYMLLSHALVASLHPVPLAAAVCSGAAVAFGAVALWRGELPHTGAAGWTLILAMAVIGTVVAISALAAGTARVGPSTAVLLQTVEPMTATLLAYTVLGERLRPVQWLGAAIVVTAVVLLAGGWERLRRAARRA